MQTFSVNAYYGVWVSVTGSLSAQTGNARCKSYLAKEYPDNIRMEKHMLVPGGQGPIFCYLLKKYISIIIRILSGH